MDQMRFLVSLPPLISRTATAAEFGRTARKTTTGSPEGIVLTSNRHYIVSSSPLSHLLHLYPWHYNPKILDYSRILYLCIIITTTASTTLRKLCRLLLRGSPRSVKAEELDVTTLGNNVPTGQSILEVRIASREPRHLSRA